MKKITFIFLLLAAFSFTNAQKSYVVDSLLITDIAGIDTTIVIEKFYSQVPISLSFEWTNFNETDATLKVLYRDKDGYVTSVNDIYPIVLDNTYLSIENGDTAQVHRVVKNAWNSYGVAFTLTKGSNTSGALKWRYTK